MMILKSSVNGICWPAMPDPRSTLLLSLIHQFEESQWWSREKIRDYQFSQLSQLLRHAVQTVPFYQKNESFRSINTGIPVTPDVWNTLPLLTRHDIQENFPALQSNAVPKSHGKKHEAFSSGSTGMPVRVIKTGLNTLFWRAVTLRDHIWHNRDLSKKLGAIKTQKDPSFAAYPDGFDQEQWGNPTAPFLTGPAVLLNLNARIHEQAEWLARVGPDYLLSYPSIFEALAKYCLQEGIVLPRMTELRSMSEVLRPEVRRICKNVWDVEIKDTYSSEETDYIALQCPESEQLLVQAEVVYVEVLDDDNNPCAPGEIGNVVVTPLHNFAMPLIRYVVGDLAEVGDKAACGRGLPVLNRVIGRSRNIIRLPDGSQHYPDYQDILDGLDHVIQFQIVHKAPDQLEMKLVASRELNPDEQAHLRNWMQDRFKYPFKIEFTYHSEIPRSPSGKYIDFVSEIE